jgi:hypothetical protein
MCKREVLKIPSEGWNLVPRALLLLQLAIGSPAMADKDDTVEHRRARQS